MLCNISVPSLLCAVPVPAVVVHIFCLKHDSLLHWYCCHLSVLFHKASNACYILFSQCGVLQKYSLRWKGDNHPSGFAPFPFDPYNSGGPEAHLVLDRDIHSHIYECSLQQDIGLSTKHMCDIFTNEMPLED